MSDAPDIDRAHIDLLVDQLNAALGDLTPYKLAIVPPDEIYPAEKNAHYMPKRTFDQLVNNITHDKNLSSVPFCWRDEAGRLICLSGHHRVEAARVAGVKLVMALYTDAALSKPERVAIQLSHNALVGFENPTILTELWREIGAVELKVYSGLDDDLLRTLQPVPITRLNEDQLRYREVIILFLPHEMERLKGHRRPYWESQQIQAGRAARSVRPLHGRAAQLQGDQGNHEQCHRDSVHLRARRGASGRGR